MSVILESIISEAIVHLHFQQSSTKQGHNVSKFSPDATGNVSFLPVSATVYLSTTSHENSTLCRGQVLTFCASDSKQ